MTQLIKMLETLGSDASASLSTEELEHLTTELQASEFPEIKCFIVVPAEDDDNNDEQSDENKEQQETENTLSHVVNF
ncbi:hypothetical protein [Colwellia sp. MEBiC06753]